MTLNASEAIARIRERIHDRDGRTFQDVEVLRSLDDSMRRIYTKLRTHGDNEKLDLLDVTISTGLTQLATGVYSWTPPEYMVDPQLFELVSADGQNQVQIAKAALEHKDVARGVFPSMDRVWHWGPANTIQFRGYVDGYQTLRVWYVRQIPALFYAAATGGSSATSLIVPSTVTGGFKARDGLYVNSWFEALGTFGGSNTNQVRRCTAQVGATLTVEAFPATMAGVTFSMVLPLADEYCEFLVSLGANELLRRQGSIEEREMALGEITQLWQDFEAGIATRQSGEPPRFWSSRRLR